MPSSKNSETVMRCIKNRKADLISVFGSKCCLCGFDLFQEGLEFHHVNPEEKSFGIGASNAVTKSLAKQLEEAEKCVLLCSNCHRGVHAGYYEIPEDYKKFYSKERAQELLDILYQKTHHSVGHCIDCGIEISDGAVRCDACSHQEQRKVKNRPNREELKDLIRNNAMLAVGRMFGVTDNTIRKWCKSVNLPTKKTIIDAMSDEEWEKI